MSSLLENSRNIEENYQSKLRGEIDDDEFEDVPFIQAMQECLPPLLIGASLDIHYLLSPVASFLAPWLLLYYFFFIANGISHSPSLIF